MERDGEKSHKFLKATEKDIREFASATFGDGSGGTSPRTSPKIWHRGHEKGARRLLL